MFNLNEDVDVIYEDIDENGYYVNINNTPTIIINKKLTGITEKLTLAEEMAHYSVGVTPTLPFANDYYTKLIRSKNEFKAFKWLQGCLLPSGVENAKYDTVWDLSDKFELPVDFIEKAIEYRKENYNG